MSNGVFTDKTGKKYQREGFSFSFNTATTAKELRDALSKVPDGVAFDSLLVRYYSPENENCTGEETPDEDHSSFAAILETETWLEDVA